MKNSYILLRNNKESNSLSIEDLKEIGLKKTDLIWVECQSMDWRSPLEIVELKDLVSENSNNNIKNNPKKLVLKEVPGRVKLVEQHKSGETLTDHEEKNQEKYNYPQRVIISGVEKKEIDTRSNNQSSPWGIITEEQLTNKGQKIHQGNNVFSFQSFERFKKTALYTGLILAGALLMLLIQDLSSKKIIAPQQEILQSVKTPTLPVSTPVILNKDSSTSTGKNIDASNQLTENDLVSTKKVQKKSVTPLQNIPLKTDVKSDDQDTVNNNKSEKNSQPAVTVTNLKPVVSIEDISSKIALTANNYNVGFFGGIRNLTMTLQNSSKYMLDKVNVEVRYLNTEGKIISTEDITFQNVKAGGVQELKVNKSKRGVKVEFQITHIESKAITITGH